MENYYNPKIRQKCHCGVSEGSLHRLLCPLELCPTCQTNVTENCYCKAIFLGKYNADKWPDTSGLKPDYFNNGPTYEEDELYWKQAKRIPYVRWRDPQCRRCGKQDMCDDDHMISDEEWNKYIIKTSYILDQDQNRGYVCYKCFKIIKKFIDNPEK